MYLITITITIMKMVDLQTAVSMYLITITITIMQMLDLQTAVSMYLITITITQMVDLQTAVSMYSVIPRGALEDIEAENKRERRAKSAPKYI
jgi:hypothetical protein